MSITTQALVAPKANGSLKIQDIHLDDLRPNEALVEIHAVGICHADISCLNGTIPVNFPCVFGHEGWCISSLKSRLANKICLIL
jgi:Zn-dependent alcohol dehydrogenase